AMRAYFLPNNCGKEAITLNLAAPEGRALLHDLVARLPVDVLATNQRPRSYAALGIDEPTLRAVRHDLIWLGISGFGPDHDGPASDPVLQARAGFMALTGEPEGAPTPFGAPMVGRGAAEHAYGEVMKALYRRERTGEGARIDVAMFRSAVSWLVAPVAVESLGERVTRRGSGHQFFAPVGVHGTRDGHVYVAVGNDAQWKALAALPVLAGIDRPEYAANAGRIADAARLHAALGERLGRLTSEQALTLLRGADVPVARVATLPEVIADPLVAPGLVRVRDPKTGVTLALPAPAPAVWAALHRADFGGAWYVRALLALRGLRRPRGAPRLTLDRLVRGGFIPLGERAGREVALGLVGRFWLLSGGRVTATAEE